MRWPFGPPHLTLKPSRTKTQKHKNKKRNKENKRKNKKKQEKKKPQKKQQKYPKISFSVISQMFLFFWVAFQNFPFLTPWPRKRAPKKHYKNRAFRAFFFLLESRCASRNGHFWTKKTKIHKFQLSFFFAYFLLFQQQKTQNLLKPLFL